jgi:hypothetical protein
MLDRELRSNARWTRVLICSGQYDQEYLNYLRALLESMGKAGLVAYVVSRRLKLVRNADASVDTSGRLVSILRRREFHTSARNHC